MEALTLFGCVLTHLHGVPKTWVNRMPSKEEILFKGDGGLQPGKSRNWVFYIVSDRGECQLQILFTGSKILFLAKVIKF